MSSIPRKQDLPPPGGYTKIFYQKNPAKRYFNGPLLLAGYIGISLIGIIGIKMTRKVNRAIDIETQSGHNAIQPFLFAEHDRLNLKQVLKNRNLENEIMKDVKGWKAGTLYGTPLYHTVGEDVWFDGIMDSIWQHSSAEDLFKAQTVSYWN